MKDASYRVYALCGDGEKCPTKLKRIGVNDVFGESGPAKELLHR